MSIGIDFILRAKTELFTRGMASVNNSMKDVKKSLREFDVGNGLKQALGVGGIIAGFRTAITHAMELRDSLEGMGKPVDAATQSVANLGDTLAKLPKMAGGALSWFIGGFTQLGDLIGSTINRMRGITEAQQNQWEQSARAADRLEAERDEKFKNREKIKADLVKRNSEDASEEAEKQFKNDVATWKNQIAIIQEAATKERERLDLAKKINDAHAADVENQIEALRVAKELETVEFMRLRSAGLLSAMQSEATQYTIDGKTYSGTARSAGQLEQASDAELQSLIAKNRRTKAEIEGGKGKGSSALAESVSGYTVRSAVEAVLQTEIQRAQYQLDQRNNLRRDFAWGGASRARENFSGNPLEFDRMFAQYVRGQSIAEESLQVNKDIRDALTRRGILTVSVPGTGGG